MRGRPAGLLPLEIAILQLGIELQSEDSTGFHGFLLSARLREATGSTLFVTHGALYKALDRLEKRGLLTSTWEDPERALTSGRPRRRLYRVTPGGRVALHELAARAPAQELGEAPA
jgi:PadR family transcriptional regulator PadR